MESISPRWCWSQNGLHLFSSSFLSAGYRCTNLRDFLTPSHQFFPPPQVLAVVYILYSAALDILQVIERGRKGQGYDLWQFDRSGAWVMVSLAMLCTWQYCYERWLKIKKADDKLQRNCQWYFSRGNVGSNITAPACSALCPAVN